MCEAKAEPPSSVQASFGPSALNRGDSLEPSSTCVSADQAAEIQLLLTQLATLERQISQVPATAKWADRFNKRFHVTPAGSLSVEKYPAALKWLKNKVKVLKRSLEHRVAIIERRDLYAAIKKKMRKLGKDTDKERFYHEVGQSLGFKNPFDSLTKLSYRDLESVAAFMENNALPGISVEGASSVQ